ncbi:DUF1566 domain-containing protein [Neptunicella sp. SCSIO 80796]|uniref:Lcl C-terminal domain-containing protein n=1 Tax=Neptunicella plasticusilytica TaxID=3117012 RepID=UPI003A4E0EE6
MSLLISCSIFASCQDDIDETAPEENFALVAGGLATDTTTRLMWMRCAIGQQWNTAQGRCLGDPQPVTWQQALQLAHGYVYQSLSGWRLPNMKELNTIVERQCVRPSINSTVFPDTPSDDFWTSTPSMIDGQRAWVVAFFNGSNSIKQKTLFPYVRLVRNAD